MAQVVETCERWLVVTARTGVRPPFMMSPITGILGDHLKKPLRARTWMCLSAPWTWLASCSRDACYRVVRERDYPVMLLYGGARIDLDFSGLVGGGMAATINWSTAAELLKADRPAVSTIDDPVDPAVTALLVEAFPEMRQALEPDGLSLQEFEGFGPVRALP